MRTLWGLTVTSLVLAGCSAAKSTAAAEASIAGFHAALNAGQTGAIYAAASSEMKGVTTPQALSALLGAVHRKLGMFKSGNTATWNDSHTTSGEFVAINYDAVYERGKAQENFVYRITDQGAKLAGYHVNSDALILN